MADGHYETVDLYDVMSLFEDKDEARRFFKDLCTPKELKALRERWRICQLLERGDLSYRDIHRITGASLATIGRVTRFLKEESYRGYLTMLDKLRERK